MMMLVLLVIRTFHHKDFDWIVGFCFGLAIYNVRAFYLEQYCPICHHQQGRIDFNTVNPSLSTGKDFLIHSL